jgi:hypothetical protein
LHALSAQLDVKRAALVREHRHRARQRIGKGGRHDFKALDRKHARIPAQHRKSIGSGVEGPGARLIAVDESSRRVGHYVSACAEPRRSHGRECLEKRLRSLRRGSCLELCSRTLDHERLFGGLQGEALGIQIRALEQNIVRAAQ